MELTPEEIRVLGCLIEKQQTTPETYPLTLNALITACNQSSSRNPIVDYSAATVTKALDALRTEHRLARILHAGAGSRTDKYKHVVDERLQLSPPEAAVLGVLLLRGAQTVSEIKTRTERMYPFDSVDAVERVLDRLADPTLSADPGDYPVRPDAGMLAGTRAAVPTADAAREDYRRPWDGPLVIRLPRQPGQREARVMHLLGGPVDVQALAAAPAYTPPPRASESGPGWRERVGELDAEVQSLRSEVSALRASLEELRTEFTTFRSELGG